jgi:hypothetical protein
MLRALYKIVRILRFVFVYVVGSTRIKLTAHTSTVITSIQAIVVDKSSSYDISSGTWYFGLTLTD